MTLKNPNSARSLRRGLKEHADVIGQVAHNDRVSQQRIVALEELSNELRADRDRLDAHLSTLKHMHADRWNMTFWQRLRWFVRGV